MTESKSGSENVNKLALYRVHVMVDTYVMVVSDHLPSIKDAKVEDAVANELSIPNLREFGGLDIKVSKVTRQHQIPETWMVCVPYTTLPELYNGLDCRDFLEQSS